MSTTYGATRLGQAAAKRQVYYSPLEKYWDAFLEWRKRQRLRATLCDLSDRELVDIGCACRKSNSHIQMMESAKKWRRQNTTNGMYCSRRRRVLVD